MEHQNRNLSIKVKDALEHSPKWITTNNKDMNIAVKQTLKEIT